jgi:hypothetical protein
LFACYCIFVLWLCLLPLLGLNPLSCCWLPQMHVILLFNHLIKLQWQFFHLLGAFVQVKHLEFGGCNSFMELSLELKDFEKSSCCCWIVISKKAFPSFGPLSLLHDNMFLFTQLLFQVFIVLYVAPTSFSSKGFKAYFMCCFYDMISPSLAVNKFTSTCSSWIATWFAWWCAMPLKLLQLNSHLTTH